MIVGWISSLACCRSRAREDGGAAATTSAGCVARGVGGTAPVEAILAETDDAVRSCGIGVASAIPSGSTREIHMQMRAGAPLHRTQRTRFSRRRDSIQKILQKIPRNLEPYPRTACGGPFSVFLARLARLPFLANQRDIKGASGWRRFLKGCISREPGSTSSPTHNSSANAHWVTGTAGRRVAGVTGEPGPGCRRSRVGVQLAAGSGRGAWDATRRRGDRAAGPAGSRRQPRGRGGSHQPGLRLTYLLTCLAQIGGIMNWRATAADAACTRGSAQPDTESGRRVGVPAPLRRPATHQLRGCLRARCRSTCAVGSPWARRCFARCRQSTA